MNDKKLSKISIQRNSSVDDELNFCWSYQRNYLDIALKIPCSLCFRCNRSLSIFGLIILRRIAYLSNWLFVINALLSRAFSGTKGIVSLIIYLLFICERTQPMALINDVLRSSWNECDSYCIVGVRRQAQKTLQTVPYPHSKALQNVVKPTIA